jgi:hypothetical protein
VQLLIASTNRRICADPYRIQNEAGNVSLTHGGLEPAILGARKPGLDMLSFGPRIVGSCPRQPVHLVCERVTLGASRRAVPR